MKKNVIGKRLIGVVLTLVLLFSMSVPTFAVEPEGNDYPIVLVHGFAGWGRSELLGYKYWGGFSDFQQKLTNSGHTTYTATVGPFSSNWDRACELYAYIKGGTVDYGEAHAAEHGHARYGRTYPGLYPQWGQVDANGEINKIHLIGHSMGGQTIRTLVQLLKEGNQEERSTTSNVNSLFEGGKSWVYSVTSISTPHDGTTLADGANMLKDLGKDTLSAMATLAGGNPLYDFKLDQWGLTKYAGESCWSYVDRVFNSSVWNESNKDFSTWDLSTDGASELNEWVEAQSDVYYFSYTTEATYSGLITGNNYPEPFNMNLLFHPTSIFIGSYTRNEPGRAIINSSWFSNDGVVNAISQNGPKLNSSDVIVNYNGSSQIGKWNFMGTFNGYDHLDVNGDSYMIGFYTDLAAGLQSLPR